MNQQPEKDDHAQEEPMKNPTLPEAWVRFLNAIQKEVGQLPEAEKES
ncbi:hypothetical protein [Brevibacillus invocatus]|nr:hypothetical protein [Brevibacillus invocatus]